MATAIRIIMITFMIHLTDSFKILTSANATDFLVDSTAALTCSFPIDPQFNSLQWENVNAGITLRCRSLTSCQQDPRFELSRNGYNMTLIIKHVKSNQTKWSCSDNTGSFVEFVTLNVIYPPPGNPVITVNNPKIFVGEQVNITCEWRGGNPSASVNLTCLSVTKTKEDVVTITETVTREMSNDCRCEAEHVADNASTTYNLSIEYIKESDESDDNIWLIVAPTIAALIIIIAGAIFFFKYRSYSMKKKAAKRNQISPTLEDERTEGIYHTVEMPRKKEDESTKEIHENPVMQQKANEKTISINENPEMQQKD